MNLSHFTDAETLTPRTVKQDLRDKMKPRGLWVSVDGPRDWPEWCADENFRDTKAQHRYRVTLASSANILTLSTVESLVGFDIEYGDGGDLGLIDWALVAAKYQGIIIAPYQWGHRLGMLWYYGWDCASGCIWDASAIASVERLDAEVLR